MYNPQLDHGTSAFMAGKPKDKITSNDFVPGPGQYDLSTQSHEHVKGGVMGGRSSEYRKKTTSPGPGMYNPQLDHG